MSESLMLIRTFGDLVAADHAQIELLNAGIYSLIFTDETRGPGSGPGTQQAIALAVHRRDADIAEAVLAPQPHAV